MRVFASVVAWWGALALGFRILWPTISVQQFPLPGYQNITIDVTLFAITFAAFLFALWVSVFWSHARKHQWLFALVSSLCFLWAALIISVSAGLVFAILGILIRSK